MVPSYDCNNNIKSLVVKYMYNLSVYNKENHKIPTLIMSDTHLRGWNMSNDEARNDLIKTRIFYKF